MNNQSNSQNKNSTIYPYYKTNDVFERDQQYYSQLLNNTRRPQQQPPRFGYQAANSNNINSNYGYQANQVETRYQQIAKNHQQAVYEPGTQLNPEPSRQIYQSLNSQSNPYNANYVPQRPQVQTYVNNEQYRIQLQQNKALKRKIDDLVNYRDQNQDGEDIIKKAHYNSNSQEGRLVQTQEREIQSLLQSIKRNNMDIDKYRRAVVQLQKSMTNIQSVDREIYKQLKATSNRDQQLLDKATTALAKGASRQQVAQILQKIVG